jgi:hypothetical protein
MKWYSLGEIFSIDLRSLALFRVAISILTIVDSLNRLTVAEAHYSDTGVLPRAVYSSEVASTADFSIHMMNGHWSFQALLIGLQIIFALVVLVGYRPRVFAFLIWLLLASLHTRNPINTHGGDAVLRLLWFWSIFLPLGARYSNRAKSVSGVAPAGILLQMAYIYFFSFIQKWHPIWHTELSALHYALNVDHLVSAPGKWLLNFPGFLKVMTAATMVLESVGCLLVFSPLCLPQLRMLMALSFIAFHFGLCIGMYLGIFPWVCAFGWFLFLPGELWDFLARKVAVVPSSLVFDYGWLSHKRLRDRPRDFATSRRAHALAGVFIVLVTWWNLDTVKWAGPTMPRPLSTMMMASYMTQKWDLFAPYPFKDDGWFVIDGKTFNGEHVNPLSPEQGVTYEKPELVAATYENSAWRKYLMSLWFEDNEQYLLYFGKYLCRTYNREHEDDERLETLKVTYMLEMTPAPDEPLAPVEREILWEHSCFQNVITVRRRRRAPDARARAAEPRAAAPRGSWRRSW